MLDETTRNYLSPLPDLVDNRKKSRSRSDSAMIELVHSSDDCLDMDYSSNRHLYRITFPIKAKDRLINSYQRRKRNNSTIIYPIIKNRTNLHIDSGDSSTTLTSVKTRSSSPAVISTDEWCREHRQIKFPSTTLKQQKSLEPSATFSFNLVFKAKIADAPVKCICKTKYVIKRIDCYTIFFCVYRCNDQIVILTCSGKLGDDEVVCRWKRVQNTVKNIIFSFEN
jgi:hypothetical protein